MRVELPRRSPRPVPLLLAIAFCVVLVYGPKGPRAFAQTPALIAPQTKLVFFADHPMAEGEWAALFAALRRDLTTPAYGPPLAAETVLVRGDTNARQLPLNVGIGDGIAVYLQGDCTLRLPPLYAPRVVEGALGWVPRVNGHIEPLVHVDCTVLVKMLGRMGMNTSRARRETVMGEAMARVIIHEWIHYETQSAAHTDHGISQPYFNAADLLADDSEFHPHKWGRHQSKAPGL